MSLRYVSHGPPLSRGTSQTSWVDEAQLPLLHKCAQGSGNDSRSNNASCRNFAGVAARACPFGVKVFSGRIAKFLHSSAIGTQ